MTTVVSDCHPYNKRCVSLRLVGETFWKSGVLLEAQSKMLEKLDRISPSLMTPVPLRELCYFHPKHVSCGFFLQTTYIWLIHGCIINRINSSWGIKLPVIKPLIECSDLGNWFYCPLIQTKIFGDGVRFSECCHPRERERFVLQKPDMEHL